MLRFYQDGKPPVLSNGTNDLQIGNYIIGSLNDPHWKMYPKNQFLTARNMFPIGYAFTDYEADANHFVFYMPENDGPTWKYSRLLRDHFETIHKYRQQSAQEQRVKIQQGRKEKTDQLKKLLAEQKKLLKQYNQELSKLKSTRDRDIRTLARSASISKELAANQIDAMNPMYANTAGSIIVIQSNIASLENELKSYTD
jgi:hypothetical protein